MTAGTGAPPQRSWLWWITVGSAGFVALATLVTIGPALLLMLERHLPAFPTFGDIMVDTPEVYTRERLVNDRFQQEAWLRSQLERTGDLINSDRFARAEGRLARAEKVAATLEVRLSEPAEGQPTRPSAGNTSGALSEPVTIAFKPNPINEFRDAQAYRDVIRSDLMRTQLDDRHDMEGNTLYRLDFDITVSPGDNTTGLAVVAASVQEAEEDSEHSMYEGLYRDFHRELQAEIDGAVKTQAEALYRSSEGLRGIEKLAFQEHLQHKICDALKGIAKQLDPKPASEGDDPVSGTVTPADYSEDMNSDCAQAVETAISAYTKNHIELKNEEFELQYADKLRHDLLALNYAAENLPPPLGELQKLNLGDGPAITFEQLQKIRRTLRDASRYAGIRCEYIEPTSEGKKFDPGAGVKTTSSGNQGADNAAVRVSCPPDRNPSEATLATISMLQRLETVVDRLNPEAGDSTRNQLLGLVGKSPASLWPLAKRLDHVIGPYGDPMINVLCARSGWQDSPLCEARGPINWTLCKNSSWASWPPCNVAEFHGLLDLFSPGATLFRRDALERIVAEFVLMKLNARLGTHQFLHPLWKFFPRSHIDCSFGGCTVVLRTTDQGAVLLENVLNMDDVAFAYSVTPTEWSQALATEELTRTSILAAMENAAASGGANLETAMSGLNEFEERIETLHRNPVVVGFVTEPTQEEDLRSKGWLGWLLGDQQMQDDAKNHQSDQQTQEANSDQSEDRTHFGWIIRPRLVAAVEGADRNFRQIPGSYPLSAVISVPGWWRLLKVEIRTDWVDPNAWWFTPQSAAADLRASSGEGCNPPKCKVHYVRVPGSVKEIKEKLKYEVRNEPYINFDTTPARQILEIGRRGQIVLEGGRLWRSTVVRMGHQQADRIIVLPDMNGIIVEFSCVEPPPGVSGLTYSSSPAASDPLLPVAYDQRLDVPVHVWTSEGRTADPLRVFLRPFVARGINRGEDASYLKPPCFLDENQAGRGSAY